MPSNSVTRAIVKILGDCTLIILCLPCICCMVAVGGRRGTCVKRGHPRRRPILPQPLPKTRVDIQQLARAGQPQACQFLRLPLELRQCIYEQVLGGRVVHVRLVGAYGDTRFRVRSTYYQPVDNPNNDPQRLDNPAERILTAVLLSCRQVYLEAQSVLLQRNTFYFSVDEFEMVVLAGLGTPHLPDIRSVYLYHNYRATQYVPPWAAVFPLLRQMRLTHLVFEYEIYNGNRWTEHNPRVDVLTDTWAWHVLGFRKLTQFGLFFKDRGGPDYSVYRPNITQEFCQLLIGPQADKKYQEFLEKWEENRIQYTPD